MDLLSLEALAFASAFVLTIALGAKRVLLLGIGLGILYPFVLAFQFLIGSRDPAANTTVEWSSPGAPFVFGLLFGLFFSSLLFVGWALGAGMGQLGRGWIASRVEDRSIH